MQDDIEHHIGFPEGTPTEVNFSDESFIRAVEPSEKCNMRPYIVGFGVIFGGFALLLLWFFYEIFLEETFIEGLIFDLLLLLLLLMGIFQGHILKLFLIHKIKSRPNRLFKPDWKCILVAIEDASTFHKIKFISEDFGLICIDKEFVEIEMTNYRARFTAKDTTISEHIIRAWLKVAHGVKITYDASPWPWSVTVTPPFQGCNFFDLLTQARMTKWLLKKFQESFERKPDSQKIERRVIKTIAFLGIIHLSISLLLWGLLAYAELSRRHTEIDWPMFLHAIPATILFCCFILAFTKAKQKIRIAAIILGLTIVSSVSCFFFDTMNHFYQFSVPDGKYYYINWWWYNLPLRNPYCRQFKSGYINKTGKFVIEPEFDFASPFSDGLARVEINDLYGYINKTGEYIVAPKFEFASHFSEGLASVEVNDKYGYIDTTGRIIIEPKFNGTHDFSENLAAVGVDKKWGFIDKAGQMVIEPEFNYVGKFSEGLAYVVINNKHGYIDTTGRIIIEPKFNGAHDFSENLAAVEVDKKWGFIDKTGRMAIEPEFDYIGKFSEGLAYAIINNKYGYIDKLGKFVIEPKYERARSFRDGKAIVYYGNNGKLGYRRVFYTDCIDKTGKTLFKTNFKVMTPFCDGLALFTGNSFLWGYIDEQGKIVIKPQFFMCSIFSEGLAPVQVKVDK
ncbi:MAG: WG repeat-containing protein [Planctomycetes bacterium]|nr:WG repeat-containing protein [Planctomycetota bacterium]